MGDEDLPELNRDEIKNITELYINIFRSTLKLQAARVLRRINYEDTLIVESQWSQRNLERGVSTKILGTSIFDEGSQILIDHFSNETHYNWILRTFSRSERLRAVIYTVKEDKEDSNLKYYLEIWNNVKSLLTYNLTSLDFHGPVYNDDTFGSLVFSPDENKVAYIAEKKKIKSVPFYEQKQKHENENAIGEQYAYEDDWGEQLSPKCNPVIVVCDIKIKSNNIDILNENIPKNISPGQIQWDPEGTGLVGVGFYNIPFKLGLVYCTNRRSCLFHISLSGEYKSIFDKPEFSVRSPRFTPDGKYLIWLQCPSNGPHFSCSAIMKYNWETKEILEIIDVINDHIKISYGEIFHGVYSLNFPQRCFSADSRYLLFSSAQNYRYKAYAVDIETRSLYDISPPDTYDSLVILDVNEKNLIIGNRTSYIQPDSLVILELLLPPFNLGIEWTSIIKEPLAKFDVSPIETISVNPGYCSGVFIGPNSVDTSRKIPTILMLHGGPHSSIISAYSPLLAFFVEAGFGIVIANYRGSIGFGQYTVESLLGRIGSLDVEDCYKILERALTDYPFLDEKNVFIFGGSHGGFLATHLSSKYSDKFKGIVVRNPVTDVLLNFLTSDIPDWAVVESGFNYDGIAASIADGSVILNMADISPVRHIKKVMCPTLLLLGKKDLRVPAYQGLTYYRILKELKIPTKVFMYDDNHSLSSVPVEMDSLIQSVIWFKRCMKSS